MEKRKRINKRQAFEDIKKLMGYPPYNKAGNFSLGDGIFARHIEEKYGKSVDELHKMFHFEERMHSVKIAQRLIESKFEYDNNDWKDMK